MTATLFSFVPPWQDCAIISGEWPEQTKDELFLPMSQKGLRINFEHHQIWSQGTKSLQKSLIWRTINLHAVYPGSNMPLLESTLGGFLSLECWGQACDYIPAIHCPLSPPPVSTLRKVSMHILENSILNDKPLWPCSKQKTLSKAGHFTLDHLLSLQSRSE